MLELLATNDPVVLSLVQSLLEEAGIPVLVADAHMSVLEGSIGVFPRRVLVPRAQHDEARQFLVDADLGAWLVAS